MKTPAALPSLVLMALCAVLASGCDPDVVSPPLEVTATAELGAVRLSWLEPSETAGSAITRYHVTVAPSEPGVTVTVDGRSALVSGLRAGGMYLFSVAAENASGARSLPAGIGPVQVPDVPEAPTGLVAERGDGLARLSWQAPASDGGLPVLHYVITVYPQLARVRTPGPELATVVEGLTQGTAVLFTVRAVNAVGEGPASAPSSQVVPARAPDAPTSVSASAGIRSATVSWRHPTQTGGLPLSGYLVTASPGGATVRVDRISTEASFTGLLNGTVYTFAVAALNDVGPSPVAHSGQARTRPLPGTPSRMKVTPGSRSLSVTWAPPPLEAGESITGYTLHASPSGIVRRLDAEARGASLTDVPSTRPQVVTLTAHSEVGEGPAAFTPAPVRPLAFPVELTSLKVSANEGGCVSLAYGLRQADSDRAEVLVEFDAEGDGSFVRATQAGSTTHSGLAALATSADAEGTAHTFLWNRSRDLRTDAPSARVRVTATAPGSPPVSRTVPVALTATRRSCEVDFDGSTVQGIPGLLAEGDFNGDGKRDLASFNDATVTVWRGLGNGRFASPLPYAPRPSLAGEHFVSTDLDGNGTLDLVVLDSEPTSVVRVALGLGDGTFRAPVATPVASRALGVASVLLPRDLNGDGLPEVVVKSQDGALFVLRHTGVGVVEEAFTDAAVPFTPLVAGDFNGDGREDLLAVGESLLAFFGQGQLGFSRETLGDMGGSVSHAVSADFNRDGHLDLVATVLEDTVTSLYLRAGDGAGHFAAPVPLARLSGKPSALLSVDLDGDGTPDLAHGSAAASTVTLMRGLGDGTFESRSLPVARTPVHLFIADFDSSGGRDLLVSTEERVSLLRDMHAPPASDLGTGFATGDFDGDGWDDVASAATGGGVQVHLTRAEGGLVRRGPSPAPSGLRKLLAGRFD
ncbi:FG-GAP-like repeat-containing protein, partial [Pyxidicoccus sp. 3LFB2]